MIPAGERAKAYIEKGKHKTTNKRSKMLVLAILGGIFSAFGCIGYAFGSHYGNGHLTGTLIFPIGIIFTVMAGGELFMGNCLLSMPLLSGDVKLWQVVRNLFVVYIGNFVGAVLIAFLTAGSGAMATISSAMVNTAVVKSSLHPLEAFLRGLLCNMLITLGVWAAEASRNATGKILSVYFPVVVFVLAGFENANTNMYFLSAGAFASVLHQGSEGLSVILRGFVNNLVPVSLGNLVGGMAIGALYKHAHVEKEKSQE